MFVLWGGWLFIGFVFFSFAGFFHAYYLVMLAPPLAALVGMGAAQLWRLRESRAWMAVGLVTVTAVITFAFQWFNVSQFIEIPVWLPIAAALLVVGLVTLWSSWLRQGTTHLQAISFVVVLAALLMTPLIWSGLTTLDSDNVNLPGAYRGDLESGGPGNAKREADPELLAYLEANTQDAKYLMAVPGSMQGAEYVLASGRPVLYMGGFNGGDPVVNAADIAQLVADDDLRYVMVQGGRQGNQQEITEWVRRNCTAVSGFALDDLLGGAEPNTIGNLYFCE
jgi:4-amino-4-deoxy-L-arabinose transferase-like glycosyltransferase